MPFSTATSARSNDISKRPLITGYAAMFITFWIVSFLGTTDEVNWYIENLLVIIFSVVLVLSFRRFALSDLSYTFIFIFLILHVYGAKYAYADNPFGYWLQSHLGGGRNHYDRIVHSSFGLLMAYPIRELLINRFKVSSMWARIMPAEIILSLSGLFEMIEWGVADIFFPEHGQNYVGTQGDIWDAQKDMFLATCGAITVMVILSIAHQLMAARGICKSSMAIAQ
jgi:putative membrane protein